MKFPAFFIITVCFLISFSDLKAQQVISLEGEWAVQLDPDSMGVQNKFFEKISGDPIKLPGTLDEAGYGTKTIGSDYGILTRKHKYIGPAWYNREIIIPKSWKEKDVILYLERVMWQSQVWVDGKTADTQEGLGTPHYHNLGKLSPGKHLLSIRVNNDMIYNIGDKGHSYGEYTQIIWNGIIGKMELFPQEKISIHNLHSWPDAANNQLTVTFNAKNETGRNNGKLLCRLIDNQTGETVASFEEIITNSESIFAYRKTLSLDTPVKTWDEFTPNLYTLKVTWEQGKLREEKKAIFGFRDITTSRSKIEVNGHPIFMRGNLDCVHFPLTGYPSCDEDEWERIYRIYKSYGLNHVRFHSWCPPQAAFAAADKVGIYIQAEVLWIDWWMSVINTDRPEMTTRGLPKGLGYNPGADEFVPAELERMIDAYGNHPSFAMLCIGNELGNSDFDVMQKWIEPLHERDNRRLYSVSTARKIMPVDQYMATHNIPNVGGTYGLRGTGTDFDLEANYSKATIPIIAHEVGQYPVYPLWSEINKYTGVLEARNLSGFLETAQKNHIAHLDKSFHDASGSLQTILYKALIETFYRTSSCAGFQMLSMTDYPGQGEALVGWLDAFWDSKGIVTPDEFRCYSNSVVPVARFKDYVWTNDEIFSAHIQVANYGKETLHAPVVWMITSEPGRLIASGEMEAVIEQGKLNDVGSVQYALNPITEAGKYRLAVTVKGQPYHNQWDFWVYPPVIPSESSVLVKEELDDEAIEVLNNGGKVLLLAHQLGKQNNTYELHFTPLFWSNSFFPGQNNKLLGMYIHKSHPALERFPTDNFNNWQWQPVSKGRAFIINKHENLEPIVQPISDFHINDKLASIFECKIGNGKMLVCGHDLTVDSPVAAQLKKSLLDYMGQSNFNPNYLLDEEKALTMFDYTPKAETVVPAEFKDALLYVSCGEKKETNGGDPWQKALDKVEVLDNGMDYEVICDNVWRDEKGVAWTGREITVELRTPNGIIGDLYIQFEDWNNQNRAGIISVEGRDFILDELKGQSRWVKLFVMREDTNKGKITFKAKVTKGGNLMIGKLVFVKN